MTCSSDDSYGGLGLACETKKKSTNQISSCQDPLRIKQLPPSALPRFMSGFRPLVDIGFTEPEHVCTLKQVFSQDISGSIYHDTFTTTTTSEDITSSHNMSVFQHTTSSLSLCCFKCMTLVASLKVYSFIKTQLFEYFCLSHWSAFNPASCATRRTEGAWTLSGRTAYLTAFLRKHYQLSIRYVEHRAVHFTPRAQLCTFTVIGDAEDGR